MGNQKFHITEAQIDVVVAAFYARVRQDAVLGPIFYRAIGTSAEDWRHHEARIASFWRNAIGMDRSFSGNPMRKHADNSEIQPEHFATWLALFEQTATELLPDLAARGIIAMAHRIGDSLQFGLTQYRRDTDTPPPLTPAL